MEAVLNELMASYRDEIVDITKSLISYPSVYEDSNNVNEPFGKPINDALNAILAIASDMGFTVCNYDGYVGTIQWGSTGRQIGILSHIDVVPAGEGWTYPPFTGTEVNGRLYGRGAVDDKGPMVAALFAMKAIKESQLPVKNHIRHIIGTDEESGMRCLKYYLDREEAPWGGFSPDAEFPVIHAEKGILRFEVVDNWERHKSSNGITLLELNGGTRVNVVPSQASAVLSVSDKARKTILKKLDEYEFKEKINLRWDNEKLLLTSCGQSAHSSQPWRGENAINLLIGFISTLPLTHDGPAIFLNKLTMFTDGYRGEALGVCCEDQLSGVLTLSLGITRINEESGQASIEIRYPIHASKEVILKTLEVACAEQQLEFNIFQDKTHLYLPERDPLIQILLHAYQEVTGRTEGPVVIGGGTYCRALNNFAAYGPVFPGQQELAHQADEYISVDELILSGQIYAQALYSLLNY
ncbi:MAG TPA: dipeptidase PepV [Clostridiaceae bacterium]|nr:dipeptidase PepV [Clostridiaceae bacterium]